MIRNRNITLFKKPLKIKYFLTAFKLVLLFLFIILFINNNKIIAQENDSLEVKRKSSFVFIPATAYTPETGFTFGAFNEYYFDFAKDSTSRMSKIQFGGIYTTKKQMYFGLGLELFPKNENYYLWYQIKYSNFIDRDYGLGNDASAVIVQTDLDKNETDTFNFLDFSYQSWGTELIFLKKIKSSLYIGGQYNYEKLWDYDYIKDEVQIIKSDENRDEFNPLHFINSRSGISIAANFDTRKNSNYPENGTFIQFRNSYYRSWLGSDFRYTGINLDARQYINTYKHQVMAFRFLTKQRYAIGDSRIPKFDLARVGGKDFARGYYDGTYIDNHLMAWEAEYRLPFWYDLEDSKIWHFWKRMGMVVFASGSRTYENWSDFSMNNWRYTIGTGVRVLLSAEQRVNARIDIGYGLAPDADYDKRHWGFYIYISEAF